MATSFAYILLTHRNPDQVLRLAGRIRALSPAATIVIRHDARRVSLERGPLDGLGVTVHEHRTESTWGRWGIVQAQLDELRWLLDHTPADYVTFVSGQDYPIAPLAPWEAQVARQRPDMQGQLDRIWYRPRWLRGGLGDHRAQRAMYRYYGLPVAASPSSAWLRPLKGVKPVLDVRRLPYNDELFIGVRRPLRGLQLWWGQIWLTLSRPAVETVLAAAASPKASRRFRQGLVPDELFIPTTVANTRGLRTHYLPLTYARFPHASNHPVTFVGDDLPELRAASACFARKFDATVDSEVLDALDEIVG
jgi:hypothetical protein